MWLEMNGSCGKKLEERDLVRCRNLHCCLILTETDVVLCHFDECIGCSMMIVSERGPIMQQRFVVIGQTVIHRLLTSPNVPKSVEEATGSVHRQVRTDSIKRLSGFLT